MTVLRDQLGPCALHVIENKGYELNFFLLGGIARGIRWTRNGGGRGCCSRIEEGRNQVSLKNKAQHQQDEQAADAEVDAAGESSTAAAAAGIAVIFDVAAGAAGCPTHVSASWAAKGSWWCALKLQSRD